MLTSMSRHPATLPIDMLLAECDIRRQRRGGPGGQHRNKVETAVIIAHRPTGIVAEANERRSQVENRDQAVARLRIKLAIAIRLPVDVSVAGPPGPSALWRERCASGRIAVSESHEHFAALLAEALDALAAAEFELPEAARWLGVSTSQLGRFLQREPAAWTMVIESRRARGLRPLQ
jgi:hypothetical protein